uniref:Putative secreted protein n=1 Tax=Ixodes ricinus TaxID=34613 RepID=A0A6B0UPI1_IXORI
MKKKVLLMLSLVMPTSEATHSTNIALFLHQVVSARFKIFAHALCMKVELQSTFCRTLSWKFDKVELGRTRTSAGSRYSYKGKVPARFVKRHAGSSRFRPPCRDETHMPQNLLGNTSHSAESR